MSDLTSTPGRTRSARESDDGAEALVRQLAGVLGVPNAILGRISADGASVETVAAWLDGRFGALSYDLVGSPCANVVHTGVCIYPRDVARLFPEDKLLVELGIDGYAGIVVRDDDGTPRAVLAAMGREPLEARPEIEATLRLFAARARAELDRPDVFDGQSTDGRRAIDRSARARDEILIAVADGGERLLRAQSWKEVATDVLELVARATGADEVALLVVDDELEGNVPRLSTSHHWSAGGATSFGAAALEGWAESRPQLIRGDNVELPPVAEGGDVDASGPGVLLLPVRVQGALYGLVRLDSHGRGRGWSVAERGALRSVGGMFGAAVERERTADDLRARERILHATAVSAESLLAADTWRAVILEVLGSLGEAIGASRAFLCESRIEPSGKLVSSLTHEWLDEGVAASDVESWTDWVELPGHAERLAAGETTRHLLSTATSSLREALLAEGTLSEINVPILFDRTLLGYIGFDDCTTERVWSDPEEETLHIAAGLIGSAMALERGSDAIERRERVLEAVAAAGSTLLDAASWRAAIDEVLAAIGDASGADRAQLFEVVSTDGRQSISLTRLWARDGDVSELSNPAWQGYEPSPEALERFNAGRPVSERTEAMSEPARSAMRSSGTLSFTSVPIHVHGDLWGLVGLDDVTTGRAWSAAENEALRAAASMLGAAVERTLTDEMLAASDAQLRQAQKMEAVGRLATGVAHDFNNILTGIGGYAALLAESTSGDGKAFADAILESTEHAAALVRQLLTIGHPSPSSPERIELGDLVTSLERILRGLGGQSVELVLSIDPAAPSVLADSAQLRQVVINLASNAVDAIHDAGRVTIAVECGPDASSTVLVVQDTGCGMSPAVCSSAFEPFVTTKDAATHSGLGLPIVYGIVQAAGGTIELSSAPGNGTRAVVSLPAAPA
jgi:signal transduction histidine kinase